MSYFWQRFLRWLNRKYEEHYFLYWYVVGLIPTAFFYLGQPLPEHLASRFGDISSHLLLGLYALLVSAPVALLLWVVTLFASLAVSFFYQGIKERDFAQCAAAIWIAIGLFMFVANSFLR